MKFRMNIHHVLFFCFLSGALCHRNTVIPTEAGDFPLYTATEGQNISFEFPFTLAGGSMKYLCREECKNKDVLIKTFHATAQSGRYSIRHHEGVLQVTITELKTSDSGWYICGVSSPSLSDSYEELVEIRVTEASTTFPTTTKRSEQQPTEETTAINTDTAFTASHTTTKQSEQQPTEETTATDTDYFLIVCTCVAVVGVVLLAVFLLLLYKWRSKRETYGLNVRGNSGNTNMECVTYENWAPDSRCEDFIYQSLDPVSRDQDQIYCTLTRDV